MRRKRLLIFLTVATLICQIFLDKHHSASAQGASVLRIEILRLPETQSLSSQLEELSVPKNPTDVKFTEGQSFISNFNGQSHLAFKTKFDEVDMPSQFLDACLRNAMCVPYSSLKPYHLLPIGSLVMTNPANLTLNFFAGATDRFSIGSKWYHYSSGISDEVMQLIQQHTSSGMDESTLAKYFHIDGGLCTKLFQRYCLNGKTVDGRAIKVNIELVNHKIKRCSPPYIEQAYFD